MKMYRVERHFLYLRSHFCPGRSGGKIRFYLAQSSHHLALLFSWEAQRWEMNVAALLRAEEGSDLGGPEPEANLPVLV